MISPVAACLRNLLVEDLCRSTCSLLITGHSAGRAVTALLYSHMFAASSNTESKLNILSGYFKRLQCVTFRAPRLSLLPLAKPERRELRKSLILSFVNKGDPELTRHMSNRCLNYMLAPHRTIPKLMLRQIQHRFCPLLRGNCWLHGGGWFQWFILVFFSARSSALRVLHYRLCT
jgi:hypothetical protein